MEGFVIDGLFWGGSREEYERWVATERERATATSATAELALIDASHNQLEGLHRAAYSSPGTVWNCG